jgi:hypothetical protein
VQIEPWQVPVLVMTVVILPPAVMWAVHRLQRGNGEQGSPTPPPAAPPTPEQVVEVKKDVTKGRFRTSVLAVLTAVLLGLFFLAIGTEQANLLTSAATAVSTSVSAALTVRSLLDVNKLKSDVEQLSAAKKADAEGTGEKERR